MATVSEAVSTSDRRKSLIALRDKIADTIDTTDSGRDIAALSKRLMEVMNEIDSLPSEKAPDSPMAKRRAKRDA